MVVRRLRCDPATADYARAVLDFPGLRVVLRVDCDSFSAEGAKTHQTRYFASSLDPGQVSPQRLPGLVRGHWEVENSLRFEEDRWWDEDRHVCRRPGLAERFTTLLSAAVSVPRVLHPGGPDEPLRAQADALDWDIDRAINLLNGPAL